MLPHSALKERLYIRSDGPGVLKCSMLRGDDEICIPHAASNNTAGYIKCDVMGNMENEYRKVIKGTQNTLAFGNT